MPDDQFLIPKPDLSDCPGCRLTCKLRSRIVAVSSSLSCGLLRARVCAAQLDCESVFSPDHSLGLGGRLHHTLVSRRQRAVLQACSAEPGRHPGVRVHRDRDCAAADLAPALFGPARRACDRPALTPPAWAAISRPGRMQVARVTARRTRHPSTRQTEPRCLHRLIIIMGAGE